MMLQCRNITEYRQCVEKLSRFLNVPDAGKRELERIDKYLAEKRNNLNLKVLWVIWDSPLMVAGRNSLPDELIRMAGAENAAANVPQTYFKCSFDWLLKQKVDVIIWSASPEGYKRHRFWQKLPAIRNKKIIENLDPDLIQRPGPRIFDGIKLLRSKLEEI